MGHPANVGMVSLLGRGPTAALGLQLGHAVYQAVLPSVVSGPVYLLMAAAGFLTAAAALGYAVVRLRERLRALRDERDAAREGRARIEGERDDFERRLQAAQSALATLQRERPAAPAAPVTTDGGVAAAEDLSTEELDSYITECCATIDQVGEGDLQRRLNAETPSAALNDLAREFNEMVAAFAQTTEAASEFSEDVAGSSEQVTTATEAVMDASEQVAENIQEIADVFHEQHQDISTISEEMGEMSATIEEIAASSNEVAEKADQTERRTVEGIEAAREVESAMDEATHQTEVVVDAVETLDDQMAEVGQIVDMIDDIAEQTNILALNASIEAAHADSGEETGFGVVADEVKNLAEETKDATNEIESLIGEIQDQTSETVEEIGAMQETVEVGRENAEEGLDALESIMEHVQDTTSGVKEISNATDDQAATSEQVASIADQAAETSRQNVEEAESVAAIAEEQTLALGEMYVNVQMLTMRARQLSALFDRYESGS